MQLGGKSLIHQNVIKNRKWGWGLVHFSMFITILSFFSSVKSLKVAPGAFCMAELFKLLFHQKKVGKREPIFSSGILTMYMIYVSNESSCITI